MNENSSLVAKVQAVRLFVFDVDGVLTNGHIVFNPEGEAMKLFNAKDGLVLHALASLKIPTAAITGRTSPMVAKRCEELGFAVVMQGERKKGQALERLCKKAAVAPSACAYMGDDVNDLPALRLAGLSACPADAALDVREMADYVSTLKGGEGAARELIEWVLRGQGVWPKVLALFEDANPHSLC
ncbi:MAG: HAD family hydrolase [Proteobacteria bacterium]|nr:HAD family hydrolase [Cystobacterineae bacterium]MCL2314159.1 HAD family hydrolase [Pseudomonadota bacterium]